MVLVLKHSYGERVNIYSKEGLIGRIEIIDYDKNNPLTVDFNFSVIGHEKKVLKEKKYHLAFDNKVSPFKDFKGFEQNALEILISQNQIDYGGIRLGYVAPKNIRILRDELIRDPK